MKNLLLLLLLLLLGAVLVLTSCDGIDSKDKLISSILKVETEHLQRYNKLQKVSKDTALVNYISKIKDSLKTEALVAKGTLEAKSGIINGSLENFKKILDEYIELCKNN